MITRIVKMNVNELDIEKFKLLVQPYQSKILAFKGCVQVDIMRDKKNRTQFFSYSIWESEEALENYRNSKMFREIWAEIKKLLSSPTIAWTVEDAFDSFN